MNYNFHLFTQLALLKISYLNELEYDYQFAELVSMFEEFEQYDKDNNTDLYESIETFLNNKYEQHTTINSPNIIIYRVRND